MHIESTSAPGTETATLPGVVAQQTSLFSFICHRGQVANIHDMNKGRTDIPSKENEKKRNLDKDLNADNNLPSRRGYQISCRNNLCRDKLHHILLMQYFPLGYRLLG